MEIQEEIDKCGSFRKKRKMVRERAFCEHDSVVLEFPTWIGCVMIIWVGGSSEKCGEGNMTLNQYTMLGKCT
jgi:hypothetical protein